MNRLIKARKASSLLFNSIVINKNSQINRNISNTPVVFGGFTKDFKPGPYPRTEEERIAAAKKYGLRPEDYKPFPDDGLGYGDYPQLPKISTDMKSDYEEYDDQYLKRNFGEPVIINQEQVTADKSTLKELRYSSSFIVFAFFAGFTTFFTLNYLFWDFKLQVPIAPKQFPRDVDLNGEKHYKI